MLNPAMLIQLIKAGNNPQQLMLNILEQGMGNTPMGRNLIGLAQTGDAAAIEQIARNICKQQGKDFDKEFNAFKNGLGLK